MSNHPPADARSSSSAGTPPARDDRFPPGIPFIVGNEAAERFSFYGMRAILYVYLSSLFSGFVAESQIPPEAKVQATQWYHLFMAGSYLSPLIGAMLADRLLGKYRVILWVSLLYVAGHGALAVAGSFGTAGNYDDAILVMGIGLATISLGAGGIKPCVAANVGDQFTAKNAHLVTRIFQIFYFTINFGSFFATLLIPIINRAYGPEVAFGVPGVLMAIATLIFWLGRKKFVRVPPKPGGKLGAYDFVASALMTLPLLLGIYVALEESASVVKAVTEQGIHALLPAVAHVAANYWWAAVAGGISFGVGILVAYLRQLQQQDTGFLAILLYSVKHRGMRKTGEDFWAAARNRFGNEAAEGPPAVLRIIVVFSMVSVFWALFDQHSSTWIEQGKSMNLTVVMPQWIWSYWMVPATYVGATLGVIALLSWVANKPLSRTMRHVLAGGMVAWLLVAVALQLVNGGSTTLHLLPSQLAALNPLLVMVIIPILNFGVYEPLEKRGRPLKPLSRMTVGMFLAAASFVAVALIQARIEADGPGQVHALWQLAPYILITAAEVLVSITGLEFAYTQAPRAMKSTIMGFWYLCVTLGNVLVAFLAPLQSLSLATFFWTFAGLMGLAALTFAALAKTYKGKTYLQA